MTTDEILTEARDALAEDVILAEWCTAQFGKGPLIMLGLDDKNPPDEGDYPLVTIIGIDQERGSSKRETDWRLHLGVGVVNSEIVSTDSVKTFTGMLQAEQMREIAENALYRAGLKDVNTTGESSSESYHPLYVSYSMVNVSMLKSNRRALP